MVTLKLLFSRLFNYNNRLKAIEKNKKFNSVQLTIKIKGKSPGFPDHYYDIKADSLKELNERVKKARDSFRNRFGYRKKYLLNGKQIPKQEYKELERKGISGLKFEKVSRWSSREWQEKLRGLTVDFKSKQDKEKFENFMKYNKERIKLNRTIDRLAKNILKRKNKETKEILNIITYKWKNKDAIAIMARKRRGFVTWSPIR